VCFCTGRNDLNLDGRQAHDRDCIFVSTIDVIQIQNVNGLS
jgi:hypothetical protein